ncbi:MAG: serine/threonine protein kinase [Candidatus Eisenbacteria bacterium]|nr:serine/threonine protein kinase [Candidatus Eisenbacteria bacterium]
MQLPNRLGGFELTQRLGSGAMGTVYSAIQSALGRRVVVKTLHPHLMEDPDLIARFHREARHAAALQHPNTVQVYDFGRDGDIHYIAMEFVDGLDLKQILSVLGPFPSEVVTLVLRDICRGMEAAHGRDLVHRDIKPANLMITRSGVVKVMDFGLARETAESSTLTRHGSVMGSAAYMSPEQAQGLPVDHRTDVFSTGLVGYEIASNVRAFPGENYAAVLRAVVFDAMEPLERHRDGLPQELYDVIRSMTMKELGDRCPSMSAARDALESLAQRLGLRGEDRILADFVRRADEARGRSEATPPKPAGGGATMVAPGTRAGADATEMAPGTGSHADATEVAQGTQAGGDATAFAPGTGAGAPHPGTSASGGPSGSGPVPPAGTSSGGSPPKPTGSATGGSGPGSPPPESTGGGSASGAGSGSARGSGSAGGSGSGGFPRPLLWVLVAVVVGVAGFFGWNATRKAPEPIRNPAACCFEDGTCRLLTESECSAAGGTSDAAETCDPNPCAQPVGACCLGNGTCRELTEEECERRDGEFQGIGKSCDEVTCETPEGACCFDDGSCHVLAEDRCGREDGAFQGVDTSCEPNPCAQPEPTGACCRGETCTIETKASCTQGGGRYQGDETACRPTTCASAPVEPKSATFTIATAPWMMVSVDGGDFHDNEKRKFRQVLTFGRHRFRVVNSEAQIDTTFTVDVAKGDPGTILLDMLRCRCVRKLNED